MIKAIIEIDEMISKLKKEVSELDQCEKDGYINHDYNLGYSGAASFHINDLQKIKILLEGK